MADHHTTLLTDMVITMDHETKQKRLKVGAIIFALLLLFDLYLHYQSMRSAPTIPIPPVVVQSPALKSMATYITQTGSTVAFNAVNLVARVEGFLDAITFTDGSFVKKGTPLFVIEPDMYFAKLQEAQASLAASKAANAYAKSEYARQQRMYKENATSLNNVEIWLAKTSESEAEVAKAAANLDIAKINYGYTHISAPFDGRIGRHLVDVGNLVGNGVATNLATIEQIDPIYVYFNLNELDLLRLRSAAEKQGVSAKEIRQVPVQISLQGQTGYQFEGKLDFVNTGLNASTGTMEFRALLPNKKHKLVPGLFVQVRIAITRPAPQLTVPDTAVLFDQIGAYVLTMDPNHMVVLKRVDLGSVEQGQRAILKGLDAQDMVIVNGIQNATPGHSVAPQPEKSAT